MIFWSHTQRTYAVLVSSSDEAQKAIDKNQSINFDLKFSDKTLLYFVNIILVKPPDQAIAFSTYIKINSDEAILLAQK